MSFATEFGDRLGEGVVALSRRHVPHREVRQGQGGQDAREQDPRPVNARCNCQLLDRFVELTLQLPQTATPEFQGIEVDLQIESPQLGGDLGIPVVLQNPGTHRSRLPGVVHQEQFLLDTDPRRAGLDPALPEHLTEGSKVIEHGVHEAVPICLVRQLVHPWSSRSPVGKRAAASESVSGTGKEVDVLR